MLDVTAVDDEAAAYEWAAAGLASSVTFNWNDYCLTTEPLLVSLRDKAARG